MSHNLHSVLYIDSIMIHNQSHSVSWSLVVHHKMPLSIIMIDTALASCPQVVYEGAECVLCVCMSVCLYVCVCGCVCTCSRNMSAPMMIRFNVLCGLYKVESI